MDETLDSLSIAMAVEVACQPNYLGDFRLVDQLLRRMVLKSAQHRKQLHGELAKTLDRAACIKMASIFLGNDSNFSAIPHWNKEGCIDEFVAMELGWRKAPPHETLTRFFSLLLSDFVSLLKYANTPGIQEEDWKWQVDGTIESYRNTLLGIPGEEFDD